VAEKSLIIIGAGIAGLSAGCYGQMNGYRTCIVEHHSEPGGVATAWANGSYLIDGGIHYLMGHKPGQACYEIYRQLGIFQNRRYPDLDTFVRFTDEVTGRQISFTHDLDRLERDLKNLAPADAKIIDGFIAGAKAMRRADLFGLMGTPPELMGMLGPLKQLWGMRRVLRYFGPEFNRPMEQYARSVQSPELRRMFEDLFLPEVPVWFVLLILGLLANKQMGLLAGRKLRGLCRQHGGALLEPGRRSEIQFHREGNYCGAGSRRGREVGGWQRTSRGCGRWGRGQSQHDF
jgi:phytoene desaturase